MDPRSCEQMEDEIFEAAERAYENGESPMIWRWQIDGLFNSDNPSKLHLRPGTERFDPRFKLGSPPAPLLPLPKRPRPVPVPSKEPTKATRGKRQKL